MKWWDSLKFAFSKRSRYYKEYCERKVNQDIDTALGLVVVNFRLERPAYDLLCSISRKNNIDVATYVRSVVKQAILEDACKVTPGSRP